jgi:hypothetical protein
MRRRLLLAALLSLAACAGCTRFSGPLETWRMGRPDPYAIGPDCDRHPIYTIAEQEQRGRERLAIPEDDFRTGPKTYSDRPSPIGR